MIGIDFEDLIHVNAYNSASKWHARCERIRPKLIKRKNVKIILEESRMSGAKYLSYKVASARYARRVLEMRNTWMKSTELRLFLVT